MQIVRVYPVYTICASIERTHMHRYTYSLYSRVHTRWLLERETATYVGVRESLYICTYTCTRKSAFHAGTVDCIARDAYRDVYIFTCICVYVDS